MVITDVQFCSYIIVKDIIIIIIIIIIINNTSSMAIIDALLYERKYTKRTDPGLSSKDVKSSDRLYKALALMPSSVDLVVCMSLGGSREAVL